jgi:hypothetical protein
MTDTRLDLQIVNPYGQQALMLRHGDQSALLDVAELDALIEMLAKYRGDVEPKVPPAPVKRHQYPIESAATWRAVPNPLLDGLILFVRHTGKGWIGFGMPRVSLEELVQVLSPQLHSARHDFPLVFKM